MTEVLTGSTAGGVQFSLVAFSHQIPQFDLRSVFLPFSLKAVLWNLSDDIILLTLKTKRSIEATDSGCR